MNGKVPKWASASMITGAISFLQPQDVYLSSWDDRVVGVMASAMGFNNDNVCQMSAKFISLPSWFISPLPLFVTETQVLSLSLSVCVCVFPSPKSGLYVCETCPWNNKVPCLVWGMLWLVELGQLTSWIYRIDNSGRGGKQANAICQASPEVCKLIQGQILKSTWYIYDYRQIHRKAMRGNFSRHPRRKRGHWTVRAG